MFDYIDYAEETGQKYCLIDFGWEVWKDYETKIRELVAYAEPKGVKLLLWYGVNKFDQPHKFDLDNPETIEQEFAWCEELGIKGVKVDYINSDSQFARQLPNYQINGIVNIFSSKLLLCCITAGGRDAAPSLTLSQDHTSSL